MGLSLRKYLQHDSSITPDNKSEERETSVSACITFKKPTIIVLYAPPTFSLLEVAEQISAYLDSPLLSASKTGSTFFTAVNNNCDYSNGFITCLFPGRVNEINRLLANFVESNIIPVFINNISIPMDLSNCTTDELFALDTQSEWAELLEYLNEEAILKAFWKEMSTEYDRVYFREVDFDFDVVQKILRILSKIGDVEIRNSQ